MNRPTWSGIVYVAFAVDVYSRAIVGWSAAMTSYQGTHYAGDYASFVETVRIAEENAVPGSTVVAEAVAT